VCRLTRKITAIFEKLLKLNKEKAKRKAKRRALVGIHLVHCIAKGFNSSVSLCIFLSLRKKLRERLVATKDYSQNVWLLGSEWKEAKAFTKEYNFFLLAF
jgi:hypothetical protein